MNHSFNENLNTGRERERMLITDAWQRCRSKDVLTSRESKQREQTFEEHAIMPNHIQRNSCNFYLGNNLQWPLPCDECTMRHEWENAKKGSWSVLFVEFSLYPICIHHDAWAYTTMHSCCSVLWCYWWPVCAWRAGVWAAPSFKRLLLSQSRVQKETCLCPSVRVSLASSFFSVLNYFLLKQIISTYEHLKKDWKNITISRP